MNTPRLETERLILRKFTEEDIEALYALLSDREANTFLPGVPLRSLAETRSFCGGAVPAALREKLAPIAM